MVSDIGSSYTTISKISEDINELCVNNTTYKMLKKINKFWKHGETNRRQWYPKQGAALWSSWENNIVTGSPKET
jgi:hypothetical protein